MKKLYIPLVVLGFAGIGWLIHVHTKDHIIWY
jgi:hypothetical protein